MDRDEQTDAAAAAFAVVDQGQPPDGSLWRHRSGGLYLVVARGLIEATLTPAVAYRGLGHGRVFIRPLAQFLDGRFTRQPNTDGRLLRRQASQEGGEG